MPPEFTPRPLEYHLGTVADKLSVSYQAVYDATDKLNKESYWHIENKKAHEEARRLALLSYAHDIKELGSNEALREARLDVLTAATGDKVEESALHVESLRHALNLATITLEGDRAQLRV